MAKKESSENSVPPECFIIMPITDTEGYNEGHFKEVYEYIIKVSCENAGYSPIRADQVKQTNLIHLDILKKLIELPMAVCDLSNRNPNVLFELGLRQAFDKPTVLIQECGTPQIFDISPLRFTEYRKELKYREVLEDQISLTDAILATKNATDKNEGVNSLIKLLSLSSPASLSETGENDPAKTLQVVMAEMSDLKSTVRRSMRKFDENDTFSFREKEDFEYEFERANIEFKKLMKTIISDAPAEYVMKKADEIQMRLSKIIEKTSNLVLIHECKRMNKRIDAEVMRVFSKYTDD